MARIDLPILCGLQNLVFRENKLIDLILYSSVNFYFLNLLAELR